MSGTKENFIFLALKANRAFWGGEPFFSRGEKGILRDNGIRERLPNKFIVIFFLGC